MVVKGYFTCPGCHKRLQRVDASTILYRAPIYCRRCGISWYPSIWMGRELEEDEPFPLEAGMVPTVADGDQTSS